MSQFIGLLVLYVFACAAPLGSALAVVGLYVAAWDRFEIEPLRWWRRKAAVLAITAASIPLLAGALPDVRLAGVRAILAVNMCVTLRWPRTFGEALTHALGIGLVALLYCGALHPSPVVGSPVLDQPLPWWWIAAYTAWNFAFVVHVIPASTTGSVSMLAAPVLVALLFGPSSWCHARATMLAYGVVIGMASRRRTARDTP